MNVHDLKCWPAYFDAIKAGTKKFEVRLNDRDYRVGDVLILRRFDPESNAYNGDKMERVVTYIMHGGQFGIAPDHCVMAIGD